MKGLLAALLILLCTPTVYGAGLGTPILSPPISTTRFFDPDRLVTTGGVKYSASDDLTLEPELGLDYRMTERDFSGGIEESTHRVHALAGWRLSLADTFYLSAAAKLGVLSVGSAASYTGQDISTRHDYDFIRTFRNIPAYTGELGVRLGPRSDFTFYFDQSPAAASFFGQGKQEERVGTRIIWKFW
jgi:hypothetical protein